MAARFVRDEEVVGSNPATPTVKYQVRGLIRLAGRVPEWFVGPSWGADSQPGFQGCVRKIAVINRRQDKSPPEMNGPCQGRAAGAVHGRDVFNKYLLTASTWCGILRNVPN